EYRTARDQARPHQMQEPAQTAPPLVEAAEGADALVAQGQRVVQLDTLLARRLLGRFVLPILRVSRLLLHTGEPRGRLPLTCHAQTLHPLRLVVASHRCPLCTDGVVVVNTSHTFSTLCPT